MASYEYFQPNNRKVTIQEHNDTSPRGEGTSSDIVYIPGLAYPYLVDEINSNGTPTYSTYTQNDLKSQGLETEEQRIEAGYELNKLSGTYYKKVPFDTPVYCTSVSQFESVFGKLPYQFTEADFESNEQIFEKIGDCWTAQHDDSGKLVPMYDKAYIYAKELLSAGLPVYYCAIESKRNDAVNGYGAEETFSTITDASDSGAPTVEWPRLTLKGDVYLDLPENNDKYFQRGILIYSIPELVVTDAKDETQKFSFKILHNNDTLYDFKYEYAENTEVGEEKKNGWKLDRDTLPSGIKTIRTNDEDHTINILIAPSGTISLEFDKDSDVSFGSLNAVEKIIENLRIQMLNVPESKDEDSDGAADPPSPFYSYNLITKTYSVLNKFNAGSSIVYEKLADSYMSISEFYDNVQESFKVISDKSEYSVKYLTCGGYPVLSNDDDLNNNTLNSVANAMLACAEKRQDAVAILDHSDNISLPLGVNTGSIYDKLQKVAVSYTAPKFGTMFTPWGNYSTNNGTQAMPASFGYLLSLASAIKTSPNWLAIAGVARGLVPQLLSLRTATPLNNTIAEDYQPKFGGDGNKYALNAITNIRPYGLTLWGNRTLHLTDPRGTTALNFLNTRNMISDIKKLSYTTAKSLMFEQDSDILWLKFKAGVAPLLDRLKSGFGISDYKIIRTSTKFNGQPLTNGEIAATIKIFPLYAIEYFEITVLISDQDVAVE